MANGLYQVANGGKLPLKVDITETSLSGNQAYTTMQANKIQWKGVDDAKINPPDLPQDKSQEEIALEAQRIRVFKVMYTPSPASTFLNE